MCEPHTPGSCAKGLCDYCDGYNHARREIDELRAKLEARATAMSEKPTSTLSLPLSVRWFRADTPDGGCVALVDACGDHIAFCEASRFRWRSSIVGLRFLAIASAVNICTELGKTRDKEGYGDE